MEINGLPAHVLIVHVVVVLVPLAAIAAIVVSLWPAAQRKLTFLVPLAAVVGLAAVPLAVMAGNDFAARLGNPAFIAHHRDLGNEVWPFVTALAVTTIAQWLLLRRPDPASRIRWWIAVPVVLSAVGSMAIVVLAGDAGAQAVWGSTLRLR
jgi:hypothetical protein